MMTVCGGQCGQLPNASSTERERTKCLVARWWKLTLQDRFCLLSSQAHFLPRASCQICPVRSLPPAFQPIDEIAPGREKVLAVKHPRVVRPLGEFDVLPRDRLPCLKLGERSRRGDLGWCW